MHNLKLVISYDGTDFLGWQKTKEGRSVEETLETVLVPLLGEKIDLLAASRTDAGVHAKSQVVTCKVAKLRYPLPRLLYSINTLLPSDLSLLSLEEVDLHFHATLSAKSKAYFYQIDMNQVANPFLSRYSWHVPFELDLLLMREATHYLIGYKDFKSLYNRENRPQQDTHRELIDIQFSTNSEHLLTIHLKANRFLYRMARNMTGLLVSVGKGKITPTQVKEILSCLDRKEAPLTAPAKGLFLDRVYY